jgi:hypothetical protein
MKASVLVSEGCGAVRLQSDDAKKQADFADPETLSPDIFSMAPINTVECENSLPPRHLGLVSRPVPATSRQKWATILCDTRPALQPIQKARNKSKWIVHLHAAPAKRIHTFQESNSPSKGGGLPKSDRPLCDRNRDNYTVRKSSWIFDDSCGSDL